MVNDVECCCYLGWPAPVFSVILFWCQLLCITLCAKFNNHKNCMPKILGVTWPRPRSFRGKLFVRPPGFTKTKLCTKFEVSSWSSFENMFDPMPQIWGVTWPRPRPLWGKLFVHPLGFPKAKLLTKFEVSISCKIGLCSIVRQEC